ncbi:Predicted component of the type VI protein secretion system [Hymenobacter daecheongensis DSM 21074]|uniref:Predicted component of the type VI protein secretion system n=1 Tax=Hymenobacter daecheongensis DSM 21074 TaxID=1121955 RepID=A0A1M6AX78_9BACT|nr:DUF4382 domain-containing protein [Hymenobacter daecheongensis]SHI41085.1 Predicted component of the type VI protein secretion system [Hymenobacter daecheongensis DSM 21074]
MKLNRLLSFAALAALALTGCSKDSDSDKSAKLEVRLTDAPGDFRAVSLDVRQIEVHLKDEKEPDGWQFLTFTPQMVNIMDYVNGKSALLVSTDFAPGDIKEIRLILGPNSTVTGNDGFVYDLKTPSGQSSGVKLKLDKVSLRQSETFQLLLDFDVAKSIKERGNWDKNKKKEERYILKPVIRLVAQALSGSLRGSVTPAAALPQILAIRTSLTPADTFSTATDGTGSYQLNGLPSGTYRVQAFPTVTAPSNQSPYKVQEASGVTVTTNTTTTQNFTLQ